MNRNQRRMAAYNAMKAEQKLEMQSYCRKIDNAFTKLSEGCSKRVFNAVTRAQDKQKEAVKSIKRRNLVCYRNDNPLGNKIHAVQRANFNSKPPVPLHHVIFRG